MSERARQDSQADVDITPSWKDLAAAASRAVERVDSDDTGRYLALDVERAQRALASADSGEHVLRLPPKLKVVARH